MRRAQSGRRVPETSLSIESAGALRVFILVHVTCVTGGVVCVRTSPSDEEWGNRQEKKKKILADTFFFVLLPPPVKTVPLSPQKTSRRDSPVISIFSSKKANIFVILVNPPQPEVNTDIMSSAAAASAPHQHRRWLSRLEMALKEGGNKQVKPVKEFIILKEFL